MSELLVEQLQALLPPASYDPKGKVLLAQLTAEGAVLGDALEGLEAVKRAIFPSSAGDYIADWERTYDLTPAAGASQDERVQTVEAAMADLGGQSIPYFIRLASLFGVPITIESFRIPVVGLLNAGDPIYAGDWAYTWRVDAPLEAYFNAPMETRITERRPGNTDVVFGYGKEIVGGIVGKVDQLFNAIHYVVPAAVTGIEDL
ncbi:putative phage tail protein [Pseudomonas veronii]|uniref:putative phage tail protein n=1 Tax=Pseudomonas veronii TaxID=76761 RepID=UPI002D79D29E|nr:putative phage tail protein [Pseudomonas veronii]WRU61120.1 putative phage tail protein [Pseudomonas veronii]